MITRQNNTTIKINATDLSGKGLLEIFAQNAIQKAVFCVKEETTERVFEFIYDGSGNEMREEFFIENPLLWNLSSPHLYTYTLTVFFDGEEEKTEGKFGFRNFSTNGKEICINGTPLFIRGFIRGAAAHDHGNNCGLSEEDFYRKNQTRNRLFVLSRYG